MLQCIIETTFKTNMKEIFRIQQNKCDKRNWVFREKVNKEDWLFKLTDDSL